MLRYMVILVLGAGLLSCAATQDNSAKVNCNEANWFEVGNNTALDGKPIRSFDKYVKQCGTALPELAKTQYIQGYTEALSQICTYEVGFAQGLENLPSVTICPLETRNNFAEGYKMGNFAYREKMRKIDQFKRLNELDKQQQELDKPVADDTKPVH